MWGVVFTACVVSPSFFPFQYSQAWLWCAWLVLSFFSKIISWQHAINCPVWQFRGAGRLRCRATHSRARRCCFGLWSQLKGRPDGEGGHVVNTDMCTHTHSHTHTPTHTYAHTLYIHTHIQPHATFPEGVDWASAQSCYFLIIQGATSHRPLWNVGIDPASTVSKADIVRDWSTCLSSSKLLCVQTPEL
jgi:hypothetical protein